MQRFHRVGTIALGLVIIALTFHLIAISYDRWRISVCDACSPTYYFREWRTSIRERCYRISLTYYYNYSTDLNQIKNDPYAAYVCVPNQFLFPKQSKYTQQCLEYTKLGPHGICITNLYNKDMCTCDYTATTKGALAFAIISSVTLGCMVFVGHFVTYIEHSFILDKLIPAGFISLIIAFASMIFVLIVAGHNKYEEVTNLLGWWSPDLLNNATFNINNENLTDLAIELNPNSYSTSIGFSFGMEIIAAMLTLATAILYALMFFSKKRPDSGN